MPKVTLIGDEGSGKSSLLERYLTGSFNPKIIPTIGAAFQNPKIKIESKEIKFDVWDTAGQERFHSLVPMYTRGASIIVINIALKKPNGEAENIDERLKDWLKIYRSSISGQPQATLIVALNKADLLAGENVSNEVIDNIKAQGVQAVYVTTAKNNEGVTELFNEIGRLAAPIQEREEAAQKAKKAEMAKAKELTKSSKNFRKEIFKILAGILVVGLIVGAVLLFTFPPAGLATILATTAVAGLTVGNVVAMAACLLAAIALVGTAAYSFFSRRKASSKYTKLTDSDSDENLKVKNQAGAPGQQNVVGHYPSGLPGQQYHTGRPLGDAPSSSSTSPEPQGETPSNKK